MLTVILIELDVDRLGTHAKHAIPVREEVDPARISRHIPDEGVGADHGRGAIEDAATVANEGRHRRRIVGEAVEVAAELGTLGNGCLGAGGSGGRGAGEDRDGSKELHFGY